jgi:hypothetical protein
MPPPDAVIPSSTARTSGTAALLHVNTTDVGELVGELVAELGVAGAGSPVVPLEPQAPARSMVARRTTPVAVLRIARR